MSAGHDRIAGIGRTFLTPLAPGVNTMATMLTMPKWEPRLMALGLAIFVLAMLSGCAPTGARALVKGEELVNAAEYTRAVQMLERATATLPRNARAWNFLGLAYHGAQQPEKAMQAYLHALTLDANLSAAYYNLGCLQFEQKHPAEAVSRLTTFCVLEPGSGEGWLKLGLAQLQMHQVIPAGNSFTNALRLQARNPEAWNGLGMVHLQRNRYREALSCFSNALQQQPKYGPALLNEAILYHQYLKNLPTALERYREYLSLQPTPANATTVLAVARQLEQELQPRTVPAVTSAPPQFAMVAPRPLVKSNVPNHVPTDPAVKPPTPTPERTLTGPTTNPPKTEPPITLAKANPPPPGNLSPHPSKSSLIAGQNNPPPPTPSSAPPKPVLPQSTTARLPARDETPLPAPRQPEKVTPPPSPAPSGPDESLTTLVPTNLTPVKAPEPRVRQENNPPEVASAPASPEVLSKATNSPTPAKRTFLQRINPVRWLKPQPKSPTSVTPLGASDRRNNHAETVAAMKGPTNPPPQFAQARSLPRQSAPARYPYRSPARPAAGNRSEAERYFVLGVQAQKDGDWATAIDAYQKATAADPSYYDAHYNAGLACYHSARLSMALLEFELALAIEPRSFNARYDFALALEKANYPRDAANELEKLLAVAPADVRVHLLLGNLYAQQLGQPQPARHEYLKVLELDPGNSQASAIRYWLSQNP